MSRHGKREDSNLQVALDYFGDKEKAAVFVEVLSSAEVAGEATLRIAESHFNGDLPVAARFLHASSKLQQKRAQSSSGTADDHSIGKGMSSPAVKGGEDYGQTTEEDEEGGVSMENSEEDGMQAGEPARMDKLGRNDEESSSFSLPSVQSSQENKLRISIEDLRRMENVTVMGQHGRPVRLLSARRPRSYA